MIHLSRPKSKYRTSTLQERAVQFAPFAALKGYDQCIEDASRFKEQKRNLSNEQKIEVNDIVCHLKKEDKIQIEVFIQDTYKIIQEKIKKVDLYNLLLYFQDGQKISIREIYSIRLL